MNYDVTHLLEISKELQERSDKLNEAIIEFEKELQKLNLGVVCWIELSSTIHLGYGKFNKHWQLLIRYKNSGEDEEILNSLKEAPRNLRLYGYKKRLLIFPAIEKAAESLNRRIEKVLNGEEDD